jgi:hypothetical protein
MDLNVDVIDNETGEIYREGVLLANAHIFIAKESGKIVRDEVDIIDLDDIDGGGQMEVRNIYVDFPEEKLKRELSAAAIIKARDFWQYENGGGQVHKPQVRDHHYLTVSSCD